MNIKLKLNKDQKRYMILLHKSIEEAVAGLLYLGYNIGYEKGLRERSKPLKKKKGRKK